MWPTTPGTAQTLSLDARGSPSMILHIPIANILPRQGIDVNSPKHLGEAL
jgi:hypothetical protein